jgi:hypothetical protein
VNVARPSKWGNEFVVGEEVTLNIGGNVSTFIVRDRAQAVELYRAWQAPHYPIPDHPLRGENLACWCPLDQPCHADVLLELANRVEP